MIKRPDQVENRERSVLETKRPKQLWEINSPENIRRFKNRVCIDCRQPIMKHFILPFPDPQRRAEKYCWRDGTARSTGIAHV